jgi:hypothetical protein
MRHLQVILALAISLACGNAWSQQAVPPATSPAATIAPGPPYLQPGSAMIQPAPQIVPIYPAQSTVVPLPSQTPGSIFGPPMVAAPGGPAGAVPPLPAAAPVSPLAQIAPGGVLSPHFGLPVGPEASVGPGNPLLIPVADDEFAWDQIADVVSDYFRIAREERARRGPDGLVEGRIDTVPQVGATWLEPHRRDSVGSFNRWESTFQTIRRRAIVRVIPDATGYLVEVIVEKELEDLPKPEHATAGAATFRNDGSLPSRRLEQVGRTRASPCWIQLGRDPPLEQRILADIHARLSGVNVQPGSIFAQ